MKFTFILLTIFINFFSVVLIKSEENIYSNNSKLEKNLIENKVAIDKYKIMGIHIVKVGDTLSSISKLYSINKNLIIKLNNLKDENYIYVGQNLIISEDNKNSSKKISNIKEQNNYHNIQPGETLTDISNQYQIKMDHLIEINNLKNPDSIKVGDKLFLRKNNAFKTRDFQEFDKNGNKLFLNLDNKTYGPILIQSKDFETVNGRQIIKVSNLNNKNLFISIKCETKELDVRIPGRKWRGWKAAKEEFEKNLINDFCS